MKFGWTIIYVEDVIKSLEFYETCFGIGRGFVHESEQYAELDTGDTRIAFSQHDLASSGVSDYTPITPDAPPPGIEIALISEDVPAAFQRAVENGATAISSPETKPWGQVVAYVRDLNGVIVEIASPIG
jgi:uncharacterized glyoxalase superfamily protein PhnB